MASIDQLSRTIALFKADFGISSDDVILRALRSPRITIVGSERVVNSFAGQVCISTAAMLMARTGHQVFVDTPDAHLVGAQPPLAGTWFHQALTDVGEKLIEGVPILIGSPPASDIVFYLGGDLPWVSSPAARSVMIGASDWAAQIGEWPQTQSWSAQNWAFGAMAAAVLMAAEAAKVSARALMQYSQYAEGLRPQFQDSIKAKLELAPASTPLSYDIGQLDLISAGAVSNGFLYALLRVPGIAGAIRTFDKDVSEGPNLNRNMLLTRDWLDHKKVALFHSFQTPLLNMFPVALHFPLDGSVKLADRVAVGVDDIPARWALAKQSPYWMGVGATSHMSSMASVHYGHAACCGCLHPKDEAMDGPIPTIAFSSFLSGLMVAADLMRELGCREATLHSKQRWLTALHPDNMPWKVAPNPDCPAECAVSRVMLK